MARNLFRDAFQRYETVTLDYEIPLWKEAGNSDGIIKRITLRDFFASDIITTVIKPPNWGANSLVTTGNHTHTLEGYTISLINGTHTFEPSLTFRANGPNYMPNVTQDDALTKLAVLDSGGLIKWRDVGTVVTASNGLTKVGSDIQLGGLLTGDTTLTTTGHKLDFGTSADPLTQHNVYTSVAVASVCADSGTGYIGTFSQLAGTVTMAANLGGGGGSVTVNNGLLLQVSSSSFGGNARFKDLRTGAAAVGLEYTSDYSANYTNRSLIDKEYADTLVSSVAINDGNGTTANGTAVDLGGTINASIIFAPDADNARSITFGSTNYLNDYRILSKGTISSKAYDPTATKFTVIEQNFNDIFLHAGLANPTSQVSIQASDVSLISTTGRSTYTAAGFGVVTVNNPGGLTHTVTGGGGTLTSTLALNPGGFRADLTDAGGTSYVELDSNSDFLVSSDNYSVSATAELMDLVNGTNSYTRNISFLGAIDVQTSTGGTSSQSLAANSAVLNHTFGTNVSNFSSNETTFSFSLANGTTTDTFLLNPASLDVDIFAGTISLKETNGANVAELVVDSAATSLISRGEGLGIYTAYALLEHGNSHLRLGDVLRLQDINSQSIVASSASVTTFGSYDGNRSLYFNAAGNEFADTTASSAGLKYAADYSANYAARSLVDKAYSDAGSIYKTDGAFTGNRDADLATFDLSFTNGNVSIGGVAPSERLEVTGNILAEGSVGLGPVIVTASNTNVTGHGRVQAVNNLGHAATLSSHGLSDTSSGAIGAGRTVVQAGGQVFGMVFNHAATTGKMYFTSGNSVALGQPAVADIFFSIIGKHAAFGKEATAATAVVDIRGNGTTSATTSLIVENGNSVKQIECRDDLAIGLYGVTPVLRATTGITAAAFAANTSGISDDTATYGGYTGGQIVAALQAMGILT